MAHNSFGKIFHITTWGESHGKAIGVLIDGCPAGVPLDEEMIRRALRRRLPGKSPYTTSRKERDLPQILSGVMRGTTTGAPISILIRNQDVDSTSYEPIQDLLRPGHANYTYLEKYGSFDYRGGGRASARETACRVAAGAVATQVLSFLNIEVLAYVKQIGEVVLQEVDVEDEKLRERIEDSPIFCPERRESKKMMELILAAKKEGDSVGGVIEFCARGVPPGYGEPVYDKLSARLAYALMGIPAAKGFEIGSGFQASSMRGSSHNDRYIQKGENIRTSTNNSGGILGGISSGMPIVGRVAFKPTSSIMQPQETLSLSREKRMLAYPPGSRHDPCVVIRAVPVVEAMVSLVLVDCMLMNRSAKV